MKVVRLPFFKSCHQFPTAVEVRFFLLQNVGTNRAYKILIPLSFGCFYRGVAQFKRVKYYGEHENLGFR